MINKLLILSIIILLAGCNVSEPEPLELKPLAINCLYSNFVTDGTPGGTWAFGSPVPVGSTMTISDIDGPDPCLDVCIFGAGIYHFIYTPPINTDCFNCKPPTPARLMLRCSNCDLPTMVLSGDCIDN